jgi:hypothetical protein
VLSEPVNSVVASAPTLGADFATLGAVVLASIASGAIAFPMARSLGVPRLFGRRRSDPELAAAALIACASIARNPGFNTRASAPADPLLARAISIAASGADPDEARRELDASPPAAPRPIMAWAPVIGLLIALAGLGAVAAATSHGLIAGPPVVIALVVALLSTFVLSTVAGAADDRAQRLDPADALTRALIAAAVPAIRAGADAAAVEQILRPLLNPDSAQPRAGRLAA